MKLWDKNNSANEKIIEFTVGDDRLNDLYLIKYDLKASISHAKMLYKTNLLSEIERQAKSENFEFKGMKKSKKSKNKRNHKKISQ